MASASRPDSSSIWRSEPRMPTESVASMARMPMMTRTTRISISVMPRVARRSTTAAIRPSLQIPASDVGVGAFALRLAVGAQRKEVVGPLGARLEIAVLVAPGVFWHGGGLQVAAGAPVRRRRLRLFDERPQPLVGGRVPEVVHLVEIEGGFERPDVLLGGRHAGLVDPSHDL